MLFRTPELDDTEGTVLGEIDGLRESLRLYVHEPRRWVGSLSRAQFARAVRGSNTIEGIDVTEDDASAIQHGEEPLDADQEVTLAIKGYCEALTFVLQLAADKSFIYDSTLLKSLHFMMTSYSLDNRPGQWRAGSIFVHDERTSEIVYEGPSLELIQPLIEEFVAALNQDSSDHSVIKAAMAHLNLVMIHPYRDGNGRMARCLQTLILSREGILAPVFSSVEEYLGRRTQDYYQVLAQVGGGRWHPEGDARPWIRFMLLAHLRQGRTLLRRVKESEQVWRELAKLSEFLRLPERAITPMWDATMGYRVRRSTYVAALRDHGEELTEQTAGRDLKRLVDAGMLLPEGDKRGRRYRAGPDLKAVRQRIREERDPRDDSNPFARDA